MSDYVAANRDELNLSNHLVHVVSHELVVLQSRVHGPMAQRDAIVDAAFVPLFGESSFKFGVFYPLETFNVSLQALFVPDDSVASILRVIGTVKESAVRETSDDGVTQAVSAQRGVHLRTDVEIPNPVTLRPYRTFREIEQPASRFVLRLKSGVGESLPTAALFEADGGAWRLTAIEAISRYLRTAVPEALAVIA